jgi:hypothetical protein
MGTKWKRRKKTSNAERDYTGVFYRPVGLNTEDAADDFWVGRISVRVFPTGEGPKYRFRAEILFHYPSGPSAGYFPDNSLRELERAARKARRSVRKLEFKQDHPVWAGLFRVLFGFGSRA